MNLNNMAINMMMGQLRNKNPNAYNELQQLMNSGKSPEQVLNELMASGRFSQEQIKQAQSMMPQIMNNNNTNNYNGPRF